MRKLNAATMKAPANPETRTALDEAYASHLSAEMTRWRKVVKDSGATLD